MDGVRAYWNGEQLISRQGKVISCLEDVKWFERLPTNVELDGELWMGHGTTHENIIKVLNTKSGDWSQIGYYIFDVPSNRGTYEDRIAEMKALKSTLPLQVHVVENIRCSGEEHLMEYLDSVVAAEGEGVILRKPNTTYEAGYTTSILKVKVVQAIISSENQKFEDTEVKVVAVVEGGLLCQQ